MTVQNILTDDGIIFSTAYSGSDKSLSSFAVVFYSMSYNSLNKYKYHHRYFPVFPRSVSVDPVAWREISEYVMSLKRCWACFAPRETYLIELFFICLRRKKIIMKWAPTVLVRETVFDGSDVFEESLVEKVFGTQRTAIAELLEHWPRFV